MEFAILSGDEGGDERGRLFRQDRREDRVAVRAAISPLVAHVDLDLAFLVELPQLVLEMIARNQRAAASQHLPLRQISVAGEEPPMFAERSFDQDLVGNDLLIGGVVAQYAKPAGQFAEHGIGEEGDWLV